MFKLSSANYWLWLYVLGWVCLDLGIRHATVSEWLAKEWLGYVASVVLVASWLGIWRTALARWLGNFPWGLRGILLLWGIAVSFWTLGSYKFYSIFKNFPNVTSVRFVFEETEDFLTNFRLDWLLLIGWPVAALLVAGAGLGLVKLALREAPNIRFSRVNLLFLILCLPIFHNNVWLMQGQLLPGPNLFFSLTKAVEGMKSGQANVRVLQVRHLPELPSYPEARPYHVLLLIHESLRAKSNSFYGYSLPTAPKQQSFLQEAHSQNSFVFQRAYSNSTNTHLSFPSILSGIHPGQSHQDLHSVPLFYEYGKMLQGYRTFMISSHSHEYGNFRLFLQSKHLDVWWNREIGQKPAFNTVGADDKYVLEEFTKFLDSTDFSRQKIFGALQLNGTHYPYHVPPEFRIWGNISEEERKKGNRHTEEYDNAVRYVDFIVGGILEQLEKRGLLENTIIISTSDHGEAFGEHKGQFGHLQSFYDEGTVIPFWVYLPGALAEKYRSVLQANLKRPIQNIDILPSLLQLLDLENQEELARYHEKLRGASFLRPLPEERFILIQNTNAFYTNQFSGLGVVRENDKYLFNLSGKRASLEYYDLASDPREQNNRWESLSPQKLQELQAHLQRDAFLRKWLKQWFFPEL